MTKEYLKELIDKMLNIKIVLPNGCWTLGKCPNSAGYSLLKHNNNSYRAHRISAAYYLNLNYSDEEEYACHKNNCNNKLCWNPNHLYVGNRSSNGKDAYDLGRRKKEGTKICIKCRKNKTLKERRYCRSCYLENQKIYNKFGRSH